MADAVKEYTGLIQRIKLDYGSLIDRSVSEALKDDPNVSELSSQIYFAVLTALHTYGKSFPSSRSFVQAVVNGKISEYLWHQHAGTEIQALMRQQLEAHRRGRHEALAHIHELTPTEMMVFRAVGLGMTNIEIAASLYISPLTVRTHVKRIHAKCEVVGRARLALIAYQLFYAEGEGAACVV